LSDIDIGILLSKETNPSTYFDLRLKFICELSKTLSSNKVDCVLLNEAPNLLAYQIIYHRKIILERNVLHRIEFETETVNKYLDFKPFLDVRIKYIKDQILEGNYFD
jgi:predicted nucleotidyltransferase